MKVRIAGNSLRFRLKQPEVELFSKQHSITEMVEFGIKPLERLAFSLEVAAKEEFTITFEKQIVTLSIPPSLITKWTETELVGFEESIDTGKNKTIRILVEKDFACIDMEDADNEGTYPNPKKVC